MNKFSKYVGLDTYRDDCGKIANTSKMIELLLFSTHKLRSRLGMEIK